MNYTLEYRSNFRKVSLDKINTIQSEWFFHPTIDNIVISRDGKVKNFITNFEYKQRVNNGGYVVCSIPVRKNKSKSYSVHRLVAETFLNYCGKDFEVNHIDGNKKNNKIQNLEWLTRQENLQHAKDNNLYKNRTRENGGNSKYDLTLIQEMAEFKKLGYTYKQLAEAYKIPYTYICSLLKGGNYV